MSIVDVAARFGVSVRTVQRWCQKYRQTSTIPKIKSLGRPRKAPPAGLPVLVARIRQELQVGAGAIGDVLRARHGMHVSHTRIQEVLLLKGLAKPSDRRGERRRPWVRWERSHPLSLVHLDWHYLPEHRFLLLIEDDASRKVLAGIETDAISAEASAELLRQVFEENLWLAPIREALTDHGSEFYAMQRGPHTQERHAFERTLRDLRIKHVLAGVKHPQTNGKLERLFYTYDKTRHLHPSLQEWIDWYNETRPHRSLDWDNLETPSQAFMRKSQARLLGNFLTSLQAVKP